MVTAGGVASGIDFALYIVAAIADKETAQAIQLGIEYDPANLGSLRATRIGPPHRSRRQSEHKGARGLSRGLAAMRYGARETLLNGRSREAARSKSVAPN